MGSKPRNTSGEISAPKADRDQKRRGSAPGSYRRHVERGGGVHRPSSSRTQCGLMLSWDWSPSARWAKAAPSGGPIMAGPRDRTEDLDKDGTEDWPGDFAAAAERSCLETHITDKALEPRDEVLPRIRISPPQVYQQERGGVSAVSTPGQGADAGFGPRQERRSRAPSGPRRPFLVPHSSRSGQPDVTT